MGAHTKNRERLGLSWGYLLCVIVLQSLGLNLGFLGWDVCWRGTVRLKMV